MKVFDLQFDDVASECVRISEDASGSPSFADLFAEVVSKFSDCCALKDDERALSFAELGAFSSAIANFVLSMNYGPEPIVGVLCQRGSLVFVAAFGIIRAGGVYLPVESELPRTRQEVMLKPAHLIITDKSCLREAEYFQYTHPGNQHILCLDCPEYERAIENRTELSSVIFWEGVADAGSDRAWKSYFDGQQMSNAVLEGLAGNILKKTNIASQESRRVLDIGSGSGVVAQCLLNVANQYTAVDLARNELDRLENIAGDTVLKAHQMEAIDISFLADNEFDLIVLNGVIENFPGYNYLRSVLHQAVDKLSEDGILFIGSIWDFDLRESFRMALKDCALKFGDNRGLVHFDLASELFVPQAFFTRWAEESGLPIEVFISRPEVNCVEISDYRFDVLIRKKHVSSVSCVKIRYGTDDLYAVSGMDAPVCLPEQAAYIVYTSGSTGVPKGVVVEHRNLLHIIRALAPYSSGCDRVALVAPLSFDASIQQLVVSVLLGKTLHVLSDSERKHPENFYNCVCKHKIDLSDMTPAFFHVLVEYLFEQRLCLPIKTILIAGEILRPDSVHKFYGIPGNESVVLYNVYGPTECTVDTSAYRIDYANQENFSVFPIGTALAGTNVTIRDQSGKVLPDSVTGELWVSGAGVSRGYFNVDDAAAFVTAEGCRFYRTGDYGFVQNSLIFYLGREDQQVKIRGNRVEIGEVENAIAGFPGVRQIVVVANAIDSLEDKSLVAYVVGDVDIIVLKSYLEQILPQYCVPNYFVPMAELPFSVNRKVDKKALPSPLIHKNTSPGRALSGPIEEKLATIWHKLLGVDVSDAGANFFNLGGHSILAIRLIAMIEKEMELRIPLSELFSHPTIALQAEFFSGKGKAHESPVIKLCHCEGGRNIFLFHPIGGSIFCYSELANLLSHKYSVFAVEAAGFSPERTALNTELYRVEDLAEYYLNEILKVETEDIIFGGWSFGGLLAYEASCRYEKRGYESGPVLVLDSVADNTRAKQDAGKDEIDLLKSLLQDALAFDEDVLRALPREQKLRYLVECGEKTGLLPFGFSSVQMENLMQTYRSNAIAAARYEAPTRSDKKILLVRALQMSESSRSFVDDKYQGWREFLKEENISLRWTDGTHETMLSLGLVGNVACHILGYLDHG